MNLLTVVQFISSKQYCGNVIGNKNDVTHLKADDFAHFTIHITLSHRTNATTLILAKLVD